MYSSSKMSLTEKYMMADRVRTKLFSCVDKDTNGVDIAEHVYPETNRKNKKSKKHGGSRDLNLRVLVGHAMVLDRLMEDISECSMRERSQNSSSEKKEEVCSDSGSDEEYDDEKKYLYGDEEEEMQPLQKVYSHDGGVFYTHGNGSVILDSQGVAVEEKACYSDDDEDDDYYSDSDSDSDSDDDTAVYVLRGRSAGIPGSTSTVACYSHTGSSVDIHSISPICV